jgi:hypothetical protein
VEGGVSPLLLHLVSGLELEQWQLLQIPLSQILCNLFAIFRTHTQGGGEEIQTEWIC